MHLTVRAVYNTSPYLTLADLKASQRNMAYIKHKDTEKYVIENETIRSLRPISDVPLQKILYKL